MLSKSLVLFTKTLLLAWITTLSVQGQKAENLEIIESIYVTLQKKSTTIKDIEVIAPAINWDEAGIAKDVNERYTITFYALMKNEWRTVLFQDLVFNNRNENEILVSGTVMGRQPTECDPVSTEFKHLWTLRDKNIISFKEY